MSSSSAAAATQPMQQTFGRYQLLEKIAEGGMAEVFKAKIRAAAGAEKLICIKRIHQHLCQNSEFMALFISEAKIALPLNHGNITQVFDFGEVDGVYYLAMEYISGKNLYQVNCRTRELGRPLPIATALYVAREVAKGLHYAHAYVDASGAGRAVVHRDVSPHNVLISHAGQVKLADFGIALAAGAKSAASNVVRGKPCYLSPEQARGQTVDHRCDIFALGAVLYEMLTGVRCFEGESDAETVRRVIDFAPPAPSSIISQIDAEVDQVVMRALCRNPAKRHASGRDLHVALNQCLHRHAPDYTAETLGATMSRLFGNEQLQVGEGQHRDHLLMQLSRAGVAVRGKRSTGELLQLGTVAITALEDESAPARRRWLLPLLVVAALGLVLGVSIALWPTAARHDERLAGAASRTGPDGAHGLSVSLETEHLTPASLRGDYVMQAQTANRPIAGSSGAGETGRRKNEAVRAAARARQRKRDSPKEEASVDKRGALLNCNSWPWSVVYLDGRRLRGNTPLHRVAVSAGTHRLKFLNPELGISKEVTVTVTAGEVKTVAVSLQ